MLSKWLVYERGDHSSGRHVSTLVQRGCFLLVDAEVPALSSHPHLPAHLCAFRLRMPAYRVGQGEGLPHGSSFSFKTKCVLTVSQRSSESPCFHQFKHLNSSSALGKVELRSSIAVICMQWGHCSPERNEGSGLRMTGHSLAEHSILVETELLIP